MDEQRGTDDDDLPDQTVPDNENYSRNLQIKSFEDNLILKLSRCDVLMKNNAK